MDPIPLKLFIKSPMKSHLLVITRLTSQGQGCRTFPLSGDTAHPGAVSSGCVSTMGTKTRGLGDVTFGGAGHNGQCLMHQGPGLSPLALVGVEP